MAQQPVSEVTPGRSTIYVYGELDPPELALFNAQEVRIRPSSHQSARIEALGHAVGYWVAGRATSRAFAVFLDRPRFGGRGLIRRLSLPL